MSLSYYDPATDKIVGCEPGSFNYYHEERHRQQYKTGWAEKVDILHIYLYYISFVFGLAALVFFGLKAMFLTIGIIMTPHIIGLGILEIDANIYAIYKGVHK